MKQSAVIPPSIGLVFGLFPLLSSVGEWGLGFAAVQHQAPQTGVKAEASGGAFFSIKVSD